MDQKQEDTLVVGVAQIAPVWGDREKTLDKVGGWVEQAAAAGCALVVFGEGIVPGYPFWMERTDGARFNSPVQKALHAHYMHNSVQIETGHLDGLCSLAARHRIAIYLGIIERPLDRGGHSLYASLVFISAAGEIKSVHRKLMPTYDERLTWSTGDGHGLRVHPLGTFTAGGLNCWENWMPLARAALYGLGEDLHVAVWPGGVHNTQDITRFMAMEGRSYVLSGSGLMRKADFPPTTPHLDLILANTPEDYLATGGSCIAGPDGAWLAPPASHVETLLTATLSHQRVREERQNFDPAGHYARPDVFQLHVNRARQSTVRFMDEGAAS